MLLAQYVNPAELVSLTARQLDVLHSTLAAELASSAEVKALVAGKIKTVLKKIQQAKKPK